MDESPPTVGEDLARALAMLLLRKGIVTDEDMADAAERADNGTPRGETVAHLLRVAILEQNATGKVNEDAAWVRHRRKQIIARTRYIEIHGHAPPATMEESMRLLRERQARDKGED